MSLSLRAQAEIERRRRSGAGLSVHSRYQRFQQAYRDNPVGFVRDCLTWPAGDAGPAFYQSAALGSLPQERRVSVMGPHGLGKSALMSWAILWFSLTRDGDVDWKIPITASSWRQLSKYLMPELRKWAHRVRWDVVGRRPFDSRLELQQLSLKLSTGEAFSLASDEPDLIEGAHATELLYIFDESKSIQERTWDAAEGAFADGHGLWLACSTPGEPTGRFFQIHKHEAGYEDWHTVRVTREDAIAAGRMNSDWADRRRKQWGETSAAYLNKVEGQFAESNKDGVIPLAWLDAALERWEDWKDAGFPGRLTSLGCDVGGGGEESDKSTMAPVFDGVKVLQVKHATIGDPYISTMELVQQLSETLEEYGRRDRVPASAIPAVVDILGIGMGVVHRLRQLGYNAQGFSAGAGTELTDKSGTLGFVDWRSAAWWILREMLEPGSGFMLCLPPDNDTEGEETNLIGDLTAPRWSITPENKIRVESKQLIRTRLKRSTDDADAVLHGLIGPLLLEEAAAVDKTTYRTGQVNNEY